MKRFLCLLTGLGLLVPSSAEESEEIIILDALGVKNLGIETAVAEESDFSHSVFALGRIEAAPGASGVVSSRIAGRLVDLKVAPGDTVAAGSEVARVESRQPGDPPPVISLRAPLGGMVMEVKIRPGEAVEPDRALLEITDLSVVHAVAMVPQLQAAGLAVGNKAEIRVDAHAGDSLEGTLLRFGTTADRADGTIAAVFRLDNPDERLRPGMRVRFSIVTGTREEVLSVPREALQGTGASRYVFVKHFDLPNAFVKAPVEVGERNERAVEILSGIFPADEVVTRGAYALSFAGAGNVSLKEAMDAAHGHAHNEDGSEIGEEGYGHGHEHGETDHEHDTDHEHEHEHEHHDHEDPGHGVPGYGDHFTISPSTLVLGSVSLLFFVLLIASLRRNRKLRAAGEG